ncbi:MAG: type II secretion system major pseudopilin GspG [Pseudomonadota bacterium]
MRPDRSRSLARIAALRAKQGYSLLEVLIVLSIIALIVAIVGPRLLGQLDRSKVTAAKVQVKSLQTALDTLRLDVGRYPQDSEGLEMLVKADPKRVVGWYGPYLSSGLPQDPWGRPYGYKASVDPDARPDVFSLGSDGKVGGSGLAADIHDAPAAP